MLPCLLFRVCICLYDVEWEVGSGTMKFDTLYRQSVTWPLTLVTQKGWEKFKCRDFSRAVF